MRKNREPCKDLRLTTSERRRFIRAYYQTWGLMKVDAAEVEKRLMVDDHETCLPGLRNVHADAGLPCSFNYRFSQERMTLNVRLWNHFELTYHDIHHAQSEYPWVRGEEDGFELFVAVCDFWQTSLKKFVCNRPAHAASPELGLEKKRLWDESDEEKV